MTPEEIAADYEHNTGEVIIETFRTRNISPAAIPAVLINAHGPFAWAAMQKMRCITRWCWRRLPIWGFSLVS